MYVAKHVFKRRIEAISSAAIAISSCCVIANCKCVPTISHLCVSKSKVLELFSWATPGSKGHQLARSLSPETAYSYVYNWLSTYRVYTFLYMYTLRDTPIPHHTYGEMCECIAVGRKRQLRRKRCGVHTNELFVCLSPVLLPHTYNWCLSAVISPAWLCPCRFYWHSKLDCRRFNIYLAVNLICKHLYMQPAIPLNQAICISFSKLYSWALKVDIDIDPWKVDTLRKHGAAYGCWKRTRPDPDCSVIRKLCLRPWLRSYAYIYLMSGVVGQPGCSILSDWLCGLCYRNTGVSTSLLHYGWRIPYRKGLLSLTIIEQVP